MVALRRDLPDLPAQLRRRQRRRHRRPARHPRPGCRTCADLGVDALWLSPFYPSPHGRRRLRRRRLPRRRPDLRHPRRRRRADRRGARSCGLRVIVDLVPNHTSDRARVVPGGAGRRRRAARERARYIFRDGPRPGRARAAEQLGVASSAARPGPRRRADGAVVPAPVRPEAARPELDQPRGRRRVRGRSCGSGSTAASTASGSTSPTAWSRTRTCPTCRRRERPPADPAAPTATRTGTATRCTRSTAAGARSSTSTPATGCSSPRPGCPTPERLARYLRAGRAAHGVQLRLPARAVGRRRRSARSIDDTLDALGAVGAPATWVLSNHDVVRHVTRYGGGDARPAPGPGRARC